MLKRQMKPLNDADEALLVHTVQFGMTVVEAVVKLPAFVGQGQPAVSKSLKRLESAGVLASAWLYAGRRYFYGVNENVAYGTRATLRRRHRPAVISEETKIRRFAMLSFCCLGSTLRARPTPGTFAVCGQLPLSAAHYVQPAPEPVLGFLRVDMGGAGRWDRVLAKCLADAREHATDPTWRPLVDANQFEITLVTALPQKAERLCRALNELAQPPPVPIRITAMPELLYLIAPPAS